MSKSILVIDTPIQVCQKCKLCYESANDDYMCAGTGKIIPDGEKPDWCPLREMPKKMVEENRCFNKEYAIGYNACIDEILIKNECPWRKDFKREKAVKNPIARNEQRKIYMCKCGSTRINTMDNFCCICGAKLDWSE